MHSFGYIGLGRQKGRYGYNLSVLTLEMEFHFELTILNRSPQSQLVNRQDLAFYNLG